MFKWILVVVCFISLLGMAQDACVDTYQYCATCGDKPIPGWTCQPETTILALCSVKNTKCAPWGSDREIHNKCPNCGSPISLVDGNVFIVQQDIALPGLGGGIQLIRTWNSVWPYTQSGTEEGMFGNKWRSNFEERVYFGSDGYLKYLRGDGSVWSFGHSGSGWAVAAPANESATISQGTTYWTLTAKNGEQRLFANTSGSLLAIIDRNGNTSSLSYDGANRLISLADPSGRHLYFNYPDNSTSLVSSVTSDFGVSVSFTYSGTKLVQVSRPDSSVLTFEYVSVAGQIPTSYFDPGPLIAAVKDGAGKLVESHTYDWLARGLSSSRANNAEKVNISYPPPPPPSLSN